MKRFFNLKPLLLLAFVLGTLISVNAQTTVSGVINDDLGDPLIGVSVLLKGTTVGTITDVDGKFKMEIPGATGTLVLSYTGYTNQELEVGADNNSLEIVMAEDVIGLDEVVVTGLASTVKRSNLANAVASISSKELTGVTAQSTVDGALYGKFKGADIRANSGAPGGGFSIRLRGVTSVFLNQQPVYIIDGVYLDNSSIPLGTDIVTTAAGGGNTSSNQDDASNRIADIIPEDIESIEILKGASAAAIYGVGGAGGVVLITTKRGKYRGKPQVNFSQTIGFGAPIQLLGSRAWDRDKVVSVFGEEEAQRFDDNGLNDYEKELYDNRPLNSISALSFSGGSDRTRYYVSGTFRKQDGLVSNTGYDKSSLRANIGHKISDKLTVDFTSQYIYGVADRGLFNNSNSNTTVGYGQAFTRPWDDLFADENGNFPANTRVGSNVLETVDKITNQERVNRFFSSLRLTYEVFKRENQVLKAVVEGGYDQYTIRATGLFPQELSYYRDPSSLRGVSIAGFGHSSRTNISALLVYDFYTSSNINFTTQVGVIQLDRNRNVVTNIASGLNGSQTNVDQAENISVEQDRLQDQVKGFFAQEEVNWDDKVIATIGIRGDKSSNNGDPNEVFWAPKASLAVNIQNLVAIDETIISQIKPRIAFGSSFRFPGFDDRFNALAPTQVLGNAGLATDPLRGNPIVRPEKQTEVEFGADLGFLSNRILFTATYYIKTIDDLLLRAQIPASIGFTRQVVNAGELQNKGLELGLEAEVLRTSDLSWALGLNWWKNNSTVTRLDIPAFNTGGFAASLGQGRIQGPLDLNGDGTIDQGGMSATQLVGTIDPSLCITPDDCSNVDPEGDDFMVFGDMEADFNMSIVSSLVWKGFEFNMLWHWKQGGDGINLSTLLYDFGNVTWDYDDTGLDPTGVATNGDYRASTAFVHPGAFIEDAGYIRLREIGLHYTIPAQIKYI
ncbi:MAG: SusC/RagA family TonB-linked outer membrane protein, partial [Bacteroidota bacterium]